MAEFCSSTQRKNSHEDSKQCLIQHGSTGNDDIGNGQRRNGDGSGGRRKGTGLQYIGSGWEDGEADDNEEDDYWSAYGY